MTPRCEQYDWLDEYIENLAIQEIFADGLLITDEKGIIRYVKMYRKDVAFFSAEAVIGMHISELYPSVSPEESTIMMALQDKPTINRLTTQLTYRGVVCSLIENTYPIKRGGQIVGAISVAKYAHYLKQELDLPQALSEKKKESLFSIDDIIGCSPQIKRLREQISQIAKTGSAVLICGETGTGKEMVAQSTHNASSRKKKVFLSQNCSAIPSNLLESILFGTVKGSYTGAVDRPGIFEMANGGTIFLDEVNSMDLNMQAKILKVLEEKTVTRIGSGKALPIDVRVLSAMNEDPQRCIEEGRLRSDLFYRLSTVIIEVPALRNRQEDIPLLTDYYVGYFNREMGKRIVGLTEEVTELLKSYKWPGNVRELKNIIEGAFNFAGGVVIGKEHLPSYLLGRIRGGKRTEHLESVWESSLTEMAVVSPPGEHAESITLPEATAIFEKRFILNKLETMRTGNLNKLAAKLGISRQVLSYKLKKYDITLE